MGFENVGKVWTAGTLRDYLGTITKPAWCNAVTLHHTAAPSLAQRPGGLTQQHIVNIKSFYQNEKGWDTGPHLFADDDQLWGMCDLRKKGIHAASFNSRAIGIEVLGDYDVENPKTGRGLDCWKITAAATKLLLDWLGRPANENTVLFHRDDPQTSKSCPGTKVKKDWVLGLINGAVAEPIVDKQEKPALDVTLKNSEWKFAGERWCIPVRTYLLKKGVSSATVAERLKKEGNQFFYGTELLEGAFYDAPSELTWAPVRELTELV